MCLQTWRPCRLAPAPAAIKAKAKALAAGAKAAVEEDDDFKRLAIELQIDAGGGAEGAVFAIKAMAKSELVRESQVENTRQELRILRLCKHPFLCTMYGHWQDARHVYIAMDFIQVNNSRIFDAFGAILRSKLFQT